MPTTALPTTALPTPALPTTALPTTGLPITALPYAARLTINGQDRPVAALKSALASDYLIEGTAPSVDRVVHLDTADWRLRKAGIDLIWVPAAQELVACARDRKPLAQIIGPAKWPAVIAAVPAGSVRDLIAKPVSIRALLPFATTRSQRTAFAVRNGDNKTVARLHWFDLDVESPLPELLSARLEIERLRGYDAEAAAIERRLTADQAVADSANTWLSDLWSLPGVGPATTSRFGMQPGQAAHLAVADALLGYLATLEATVDGITADLDTEFLHDFRVAVRRTRSVLKLLGDVLPDGMAERVAPQFRWLGDTTTPTRDLDVYLLTFDELAAKVSRPADLAPFAAHLRRRRHAAFRALRTALRSARFQKLCHDWRGDLAAVVSAPTTQHGLTAAALAEQRLHRTFRKVIKRSKAIRTDSPAEDIHSLRKTCKEMRYLLDVFKPLCRPAALRKVMADFKQIQDLLGEFQDGEVQANALHAFAAEMINDRTADADAILAMGELSGHFETRQRTARIALTEHHDDYLGQRAAAHLDRLITTTGRS